VPFPIPDTEVKLLEGGALKRRPKNRRRKIGIVSAQFFPRLCAFQTMRIPFCSPVNFAAKNRRPCFSCCESRFFARTFTLNGSSVIGHHVQTRGFGNIPAQPEIRGISGRRPASLASNQPRPFPTAYWCAPLAEPGTLLPWWRHPQHPHGPWLKNDSPSAFATSSQIALRVRFCSAGTTLLRCAGGKPPAYRSCYLSLQGRPLSLACIGLYGQRLATNG